MATLNAGTTVTFTTPGRGGVLTITAPQTSSIQQFPLLSTSASSKEVPISLAAVPKKVTLLPNTTYNLKADTATITYTIA